MLRAFSEHHRADFHRADSGVAVQLHGQGLRRKLVARDVRQHARGVDVDRMASRRLDDRHTRVGDVAAQVVGGYDAVVQVIRVQNFFETDRDGFEVAAGQSAIGGEPFGQNE